MKIRTLLICIFFICQIQQSKGQEKTASSAEELAKKLANPVASLISVPFQNNTDYGIGPYRGSKNTLNFQPVIPLRLSSKLNLIARVVLPIITQNNVVSPDSKQTGLSDALVSAFISPSESKNGFTWGAGPAFLVPTATNEYLGTKKLGVGPTVLGLLQSHGWTFGALVNQIWSVAGDDTRADVSQLFLQPFLVYNWKTGAGIGGNMEMTQNWKTSTMLVFFNPNISGVTKLGKQTVSLSVGPRIPLSGPDAAKPDFGWRAALILVFPK